MAYISATTEFQQIIFILKFKGAWYLLIIHEVLVAMDFFPAGVQDEALEEESQRLAS